ncbi:MAG: SoxR reducing system RseC family protein [Desulfosarcina sp.]|nr:SoxR reducing system RseC family protein [Desulfosarcina sp.]MBC2743766.1 SoxR reducing system RseC family protein [Desulfosarcina sp.]MBC2766675.1 SoxR reducing system RseC family protein [Desulfosarcina sp.]
MAQTIGFVVETSDDGRATVVAVKGQGCGSCSAVSQCHGGRAASTEKIPAFNRVGAAVGDRVTLTVESGAILSRMAVLYLVPVFGMLTGAFMGAFMSGGVDGTGDGHSVAFGLAGFVLGFVIAVAISRIWSAARPVIPIITRIVTSKFVFSSSRPSAGCGSGGK